MRTLDKETSSPIAKFDAKFSLDRMEIVKGQSPAQVTISSAEVIIVSALNRFVLLLTAFSTTLACFCIKDAYGQLALPPPLPSRTHRIPLPSKPLDFDVVSIRPSGSGTQHGGFSIWPDGYRQSNMPLLYTVMMAYLPMGSIPIDRVKNAPSWLMNEPYDFTGKIAAIDVETWSSFGQTRLDKPMLEIMLQRVLGDRCHLVVHRAPAQVHGYGLVLRKGRLNLNQFVARLSIPTNAIPTAGGAMVVPSPQGDQSRGFAFYSTSMAALTAMLSEQSRGIPIEDHTGIVGKYDFVLPLHPSLAGENEVSGQSEDPDFLVPWDLKAIGLELKPIQVSQWNLVIDHIDRPSPN